MSNAAISLIACHALSGR